MLRNLSPNYTQAFEITILFHLFFVFVRNKWNYCTCNCTRIFPCNENGQGSHHYVLFEHPSNIFDNILLETMFH